MKTNNEPQPVRSHKQATNKGVSTELSQDVVIAISDYLDVFVEIDLALKQLNEQGVSKNGSQG